MSLRSVPFIPDAHGVSRYFGAMAASRSPAERRVEGYIRTDEYSALLTHWSGGCIPLAAVMQRHLFLVYSATDSAKACKALRYKWRTQA